MKKEFIKRILIKENVIMDIYRVDDEYILDLFTSGKRYVIKGNEIVDMDELRDRFLKDLQQLKFDF